MKDKIIMSFSKSTKHTHVYTDDTSDAPIPSLYIKKTALPTDVPKRIRVTIDVE